MSNISKIKIGSTVYDIKGNPRWGEISGILSEQLDLFNAINEKTPFIAEYGVTTYAEITSALSEDRECFVNYNDVRYRFSIYDRYTNVYVFATAYGSVCLIASVNISDEWSTDASFLLNDSNIINSWSAYPYSTKAPSEALTKSSLNEKQNTLVSGTNIKTVDGASVLGSGDLPVQRTNPNLLINGWFTVNQRGENSYTRAGYGFDMWTSASGYLTVSKSGNIVTFSSTNDSYFKQLLENSLETGKVYTLTALMKGKIDIRVRVNNDTVYSSQTFNDADFTYEKITFTALAGTNAAELKIFSGITAQVKAVKLELGEVSTLQYDSVPDYSSELLKCQRYFTLLPVRDNSFTVVGSGVPFNNSRVDIPINLRVPMRNTPSLVVIRGNVSDLLLRGGNASQHNVSSLGVTGLSTDKTTLYMTVNTSGVVTNYTYTLTNQNYRVGFSAEL